MTRPQWATRGQLAALAVIARRAGLTRNARLDYCAGAVGRPVDTSTELTATEAATVLRGICQRAASGRGSVDAARSTYLGRA